MSTLKWVLNPFNVLIYIYIPFHQRHTLKTACPVLWPGSVSLKEILHIVGAATTNGKTIIEISDALGHIVYYNRLNMDALMNTLDIDVVSIFEAGNRPS